MHVDVSLSVMWFAAYNVQLHVVTLIWSRTWQLSGIIKWNISENQLQIKIRFYNIIVIELHRILQEYIIILKIDLQV